MAYFICPNCGLRSMDSDGRDGLAHQAVGCTRCGFGFVFELLDDFYPGPSAGMLACDRDARILAVGKGVFELTGFQEGELIGKDLREALTLRDPDGERSRRHGARMGRAQARPDARAQATARASSSSCAPTSSPPTTRTAACSPASRRTRPRRHGRLSDSPRAGPEAPKTSEV